MKRSDDIKELATALAQAQGEFESVAKDSANPHFKSKYASLASAVKTAAPIISKNGLSISQDIGFDEQGDTLTSLLMHTSGQWKESTMRLHLVKNDPQGQGSATTYARRFSYMAILGLAPADDDDGNAATESVQQQRERESQRSSVPTASVRALIEEVDENDRPILDEVAKATLREWWVKTLPSGATADTVPETHLPDVEAKIAALAADSASRNEASTKTVDTQTGEITYAEDDPGRPFEGS
jgi:hypothetical protein